MSRISGQAPHVIAHAGRSSTYGRVVTALSEAGGDWLSQINCAAMPWDVLIEEAKRYFVSSPYEAADELRNLTKAPGSTMQQWAAKIEQALRKNHMMMDEEHKAELFVTGITGVVGAHIRAHLPKPTTMYEALQLAVVKEKALEGITGNSPAAVGKPQAACAVMVVGGQWTTADGEDTLPQASAGGELTSLQGAVRDLVEQNQQLVEVMAIRGKPQDPGACYTCGKQGHRKKDCPDRRRYDTCKLHPYARHSNDQCNIQRELSCPKETAKPEKAAAHTTPT